MEGVVEPTKKQRKRLGELAGIAYGRDLERALSPLADDFDRWRRRELDAFELTDRIHAFHQDPARKLFGFYTSRNAPAQVAYAVTEGLIPESEVDADLRAMLEPYIALIRGDVQGG